MDYTHQESLSHLAYVHTEVSERNLANRLSRIEGQIRGIKTMIEASRPCPEVLVQIAAVRGALEQVGRIILDENLTQCIASSTKAGDMKTEIEALKTALERFFL